MSGNENPWKEYHLNLLEYALGIDKAWFFDESESSHIPPSLKVTRYGKDPCYIKEIKEGVSDPAFSSVYLSDSLMYKLGLPAGKTSSFLTDQGGPPKLLFIETIINPATVQGTCLMSVGGINFVGSISRNLDGTILIEIKGSSQTFKNQDDLSKTIEILGTVRAQLTRT